MSFRSRAPQVLLAVFLATWVGCQPTEGPRDRTIVVAQAAGPQTLDPAIVTSSEAAQIVSQIYEPLVRIDDRTQEPRPALAVSWQAAPDGRSWTFKLRRGVFFHDGSIFDADAVVFSFERQRDPTHPFHRPGFTYWHSSFRIITRTEKIDRYTVRIHTSGPFGPLLANLSMFPASIVSPRAARKAGAAHAAPVGTGPYRFVSSQRDRRVVLARNALYWGMVPRVRRLLFRVVEQEPQRLVGLQSGTVDLVYGVSPDVRPIVQLHPELSLVRARGANVTYMAMNTQRPPFDDVRVRRAFNHAINKALVVKLGYQGLAIAADGPLPPTVFSYTAGVRRYHYDPQLAKRLLRDASFNFSRTYRLNVMSTARPYLLAPVLVARILASNLARVGVRVDLVVKPHREHLAAVQQGQHDLCLLGWVGDNADPDNYLYILLDRDSARVGSAQNVAFFKNMEVHRLLLQARQEMKRGAREALYRRAQKIIAEQAPWVPLTHSEVTLAMRRDLQHVIVKPNSIVDFSEVAFGVRSH